jgi:hypothetical protein
MQRTTINLLSRNAIRNTQAANSTCLWHWPMCSTAADGGRVRRWLVVGGGGGSRWDPAAGAPVDWRRTVGIVWSTTTTMTTHRWRRGIIDDDFPAIRGVDVEDLRSPHEAPRTSPPDAGVRPRRPLPRCAEDGGREGGHRNSRWPSSHAPSTGRCRRDGAPATKKKHVLLSLSLSLSDRGCLGRRCAV